MSLSRLISIPLTRLSWLACGTVAFQSFYRTGSEEKLSWKLIPIECGYVKIPRIKVMNVRRAALPSQGGAEVDVEGEAVKVIDMRADWNATKVQSTDDGAVEIPQQDGASTILVLP